MTTAPGRKYFYKYLTADTAILILQNRKIKYSSPVLFNDPFDVQTRISFSFPESELTELLIKELYKLGYDEKDLRLDRAAPLFTPIQTMRELAKHTFRKVPLQIWMEEAKEIGIKQYLKFLEILNNWWTRIVKASYIFCVVEEADNLLMWAHYAQNHEGAVIEFECLPELDNLLCAAMKVKYEADPPVIAKTPEPYIRYVTGQGQPISYRDLFFDLYLSKSDHWQYENEWRVFIPPPDILNPIIPKDASGNEILFELKSFHPQEIHSIYFGCKMSQDNRRKIEACLRADFRHVKKYDSIRNKKRYKLDFAEII